MINIMLDELPEVWNGYKLNTGFRVGIQIVLIREDRELSETEKTFMVNKLLFADEKPDNSEEIEECLDFFLNGWNSDGRRPAKKKSKKEKNSEEKRSMDFDVDQWRIYSAFIAQYRINLAETDMHWWEFMGLLTNLDECAYTRVIEIRKKKIESKMSVKEKQAIKFAKEIYGLDEPEDELSPEERQRYENFMKYRKQYR